MSLVPVCLECGRRLDIIDAQQLGVDTALCTDCAGADAPGERDDDPGRDDPGRSSSLRAW